MFTASQIREKVLKTGLGYDKKDVEQFLNEISSDYEALQQENTDLSKKVKDLTESISYYKSIEKTLQRALVLAEKAAQDTRSSAMKEADAIEAQAKAKSEAIILNSQKQIELLEHRFLHLIRQYDLFKINFKNLLKAESELLESNHITVKAEDFSYKEEPQDGQSLSGDDAAAAKASNNREDNLQVDDTQSFPDQLSLDFLENQLKEQIYQTEDGFEFIQMNDNL